MEKLNQLARLLRAAGFEILHVTAGTLEYDGEVAITPDFSVQVGDSYYILARKVGEKFYMEGECESAEEVVEVLLASREDDAKAWGIPRAGA